MAIEKHLENLIINKLYIILLSISLGIALRFHYYQISNYSCFLLVLTACFLYCTIYKSYNQFVIDSDLKLLNSKELERNYQLKVNFKLLLIIVSIIIMFTSFGFTAASIRFQIVVPKEKIIEQVENLHIIGRVSQFEIKDKGVRLYLDDIYQSNRFRDILDKIEIGTIRLNLPYNLFNEDLIGQWIFTSATIIPPPSKAFPNSFDFAQYAFFKGIGAIGYSFKRPIIINKLTVPLTTYDHINQFLNSLRKKIAFKIKNAISEPAAGIAAAILVGETSQINKSDYYSLRVSGLAHIIAISGMHVVVVVAIAFFLVRAILLYIIPLVFSFQLALYIAVPKVSAVFSIILSTFYVFLAGAPVSAQRALITSSILMLSILYDKRLNPIKSLSLAGSIMLLVTPEALFSPGLQMSFAACFALITTFNIIDNSWNFTSKYREYFFKLTVASISASIATAPFIIYHFNQFAPYGVLANLICVPISDFVIMPFGMASMFFMGIGLEKYPLLIVQATIDFILWIARNISTMPFADIHISSFTNFGIVIIALGLFILSVSEARLYKALSLLLVVIGCFFQERYDNILLLVSQKTFAIKSHLLTSDDDKKFVLSTRQRDRFTHEIWQSKIGNDKFYTESLNGFTRKKHISNCNNNLCIIDNKYKITIVNSKDLDLDSICKLTNPTIFINIYSDDICPSAEINIRSKDLKSYGVHIIIDDKKLKVVNSNS